MRIKFNASYNNYCNYLVIIDTSVFVKFFFNLATGRSRAARAAKWRSRSGRSNHDVIKDGWNWIKGTADRRKGEALYICWMSLFQEVSSRQRESASRNGKVLFSLAPRIKASKSSSITGLHRKRSGEHLPKMPYRQRHFFWSICVPVYNMWIEALLSLAAPLPRLMVV